MLVARAALRTAHGSPSARALRRARECRARIAFSASASSSADDAASAGSATFVATSLASTERIARALARDARVGDVVCLHGDVGAGKSVLSRAFVRAVTRDPTMEVPSPTFLLQQVYDDHDKSFGPAVHHFDLYRCGSVAETVKLDLPGSFSDRREPDRVGGKAGGHRAGEQAGRVPAHLRRGRRGAASERRRRRRRRG
jgi:tRNA threonylcarbamoyl adenosine modification protein YjeE